MTIKQMAKELNVSPQAVYQRLQARKIDVKTLTNPVTKELTTDGEYVIRSMYEQDSKSTLTEKQSRQDGEDKELEELRKQVAALIEKNSSLEKRVEEVIGEREAFREAMQTSQRMQEQLMNRFLPAPQQAEEKPAQGSGSGARKLTWRERFSGKIKG